MGRKPDPTSVRQRAFRLLNNMKGDTRTHMMNSLREVFPDNTERYNETLWASHRRECKADGSLIEVFTIMETRDGKPTTPYLRSDFAFYPALDACLTREMAKFEWKRRTAERIAKVEQL